MMGIAITLQQYLDDKQIYYDVARHRKTDCSSMTAQASHVPGDNLAKGVVLRWDGSYILAVVPSTRHVEINRIAELVDGSVELASEREIDLLFPDCESGAVPVTGEPYGLATLVDRCLDDCSEVYFEGGDHRSLVHVTGSRFDQLMSEMTHGHFSA